ncbi:dynein light chain 1, cytoplasmic [Linnemannia elongata]|nr:dynein light chain 1, cytoplasmic [Linnemannia elongata]
MGIDWFALAEAAAEAVSQVIVVVICGILLTKAGLLSPQTQRGLSKINLYFLTPCLIFTKIASALSWDRFVTFWPIPLFYSVFLIVNFTVAQIGSKLLRLTKEETRFATASIMFFNNNSLPIALVQSLALSGAAKLLLRDENDTAEAVLARGVSYILFTSVFDNLVRWSFGLNLLSHHKGDNTNGKEEGGTSNNDNSTGPVAISNNDLGDVIIDVDSHLDPQTLPPTTVTPTTWTSRLVAILKKARGLLQPPLVTAIVALIVGLIRPLHHILMDPDSKVFIFLIRPLDTCGRAAVPMILLCLGAQVLSFDSNTEAQSNSNNNPVPFILFCRMFLSPLITLPAILLVPNSLSPTLLGDPIFRLTMVMLSASPTAVNMMQICQINGFFEKKMARLLFWSYCVVGVPGILVWVMVALQAATWGS